MAATTEEVPRPYDRGTSSVVSFVVAMNRVDVVELVVDLVDVDLDVDLVDVDLVDFYLVDVDLVGVDLVDADLVHVDAKVHRHLTFHVLRCKFAKPKTFSAENF